jgi:hypothetical protein
MCRAGPRRWQHWDWLARPVFPRGFLPGWIEHGRPATHLKTQEIELVL